ncbi:hypothetical protein L1049_002987 [Liquidambar formosana]|uniref:U-box domain-containing protein n=1 Tax=Liquidambar formosana TaxID=63359 RepID=A0AAP0NFZ8_LIQFO
MVRDDLYITVPSFFRCPISLDVMKSPVSLCTGVTYDRSSIQKWLDKGNNTCPATMQVLHSKDFVPNHNLQRLIQIWSNSLHRRVDSAPLPLSPDQARALIDEIDRSPHTRLASLSKLVCFARESEENRNVLGKIDGFVNMLVDLLGNVDGLVDEKANLAEQTMMILFSILNQYTHNSDLSDMILKSNRDCLSSMLLVLQQGSLDSRIATARVLEAIAMDAESKLVIADKKGLLSVLIRYLDPETDPSMIEAALSCLISISMPKRTKVKMVQLGAVKVLGKLLAESSSSVSSAEKVLKLLEMMSSCKEGRVEICGDRICVPAIVGKILKVSNAATEHGVMILWSVCYLFRDQKAQEAVAGNNGLTKILLLMQSNCSPSVRQMSADLIKIFRVNSKSCLSSYDTKTTHIMPF